MILQDKITKTHKINTYDKIHRISFLKCNDNTFRIACAAGREIFTTSVYGNSFHDGHLTKLNDWISSIQYLNDYSLALITSHNIALLLEVLDGRLVIKQKLKCDNNSTLYCSHIYGNLWENLVFFAGTALGELIIWKNVNGEANTIYQKSLHNGVIFSIDFNGKYLISASDDRSIKVFEVDKYLGDLIEKKQLFGHTSRVFVCRIINYDNELKFISAGEDSNICIWTENGTLQSKKNINASGGIWNCDYDPFNAVIITCSSTGKLNKFQLHKIFYEHHIKEIISPHEKIDPSRLRYLQNGTLCVLDTKMQIYTKTLNNDDCWRKVEQAEQHTHKIVAFEVYDNRLFLVAKNTVLIFDFNDVCKNLTFTAELNINEKFPTLPEQLDYFRAIHVLARDEIFISDASGFCIVLNVEDEIIKNLFKIPKSIEPWTTSCAKVFNDFWICADRVGSLFLYQNNEHDLSTFHKPIQKLSRLHGQMGVTTIRIEGSNENFIKTTGNDGTIKTLFLDTKRKILEMYQCERTMVNWIEKVRVYNGCEYILGFNDNYFVVYKNREIIYEHRCGGRHRHWDISLIKDNRRREDDVVDGDDDDDDDDKVECKMRFAYIYKKQVNFVEFYLNDFIFNAATSTAVVKNDVFWHTKECNVIRVIDDVKNKILISGGEDTFLKLTKIEMMDDDILFEKIADINSHISSIKAMTTYRGEGGDLCIISVGGRAQIVLTRVIQMKYVKEEINFMLTDSLLSKNAKESTFDPETRFTCVHFDVDTKHLFVGCSDGFLRVFKLIKIDDITNSLELVIEIFYGRCILQVYMIESIVLTMATDGIVSFWLFDEKQYCLKVIEKLHHNQNGINSFDVFSIDDHRYKIATSGDDSGIYVSEFEIIIIDSAMRSIKYFYTISTYSVHVSQVTGIKFLSHNELLTASIDQTVCKLKIENDNFKILSQKFTCISDVKGFSILDKKIFIHGAGIEALKYF